MDTMTLLEGALHAQASAILYGVGLQVADILDKVQSVVGDVDSVDARQLRWIASVDELRWLVASRLELSPTLVVLLPELVPMAARTVLEEVLGGHLELDARRARSTSGTWRVLAISEAEEPEEDVVALFPLQIPAGEVFVRRTSDVGRGSW